MNNYFEKMIRLSHSSGLPNEENEHQRLIVDPEFPDGATVTSPLAARAPWVVYDEGDKIIDSGQYWGCAYCSWRTQCHEDG